MHFFFKKFIFIFIFFVVGAGCVSTFRTCVQVYLETSLEIFRFVFCFLPSFHAL